MKTFMVHVEERWIRTFEVTANDAEQARDAVYQELWPSDDYVGPTADEVDFVHDAVERKKDWIVE